jgi:malic enzyme
MEKISVLKRGELNQLKKRLHSLITDGSLIVGLGNSGEKGDLILKELV